MIGDNVRRIVEEGQRHLEEDLENIKHCAKEAIEEVANAKARFEQLTALHKDLAGLDFGRLGHVFIGQREVEISTPSRWMTLRLNGLDVSLGDYFDPKDLPPGRYRVVVILQPVRDVK